MSVPNSKLREPARHGGGRPARRPTGGALQVPRIVGRAEQHVVGLEIGRPGGGIRLAEQDTAGGGEPGHRGRVHGGHMVGQCRRPARRAHATGFDGVLHGERQSVERPPPRPVRRGLVSLLGPVVRPRQIGGDDGIDLGIEPVDLGKNASRSSRLDRERDLMAAASRVADQRVGSSGTGCPPCGPEVSGRSRLHGRSRDVSLLGRRG